MEDFLKDKVILIVDDTPENIDILNGILHDFKRKIATNGQRALKIARNFPPPDLILLDIMMPEMDGFEVCRQLRNTPATHDIPVIFLTAKTAKEDIVKGFEAGGQDYVTKPFDPAELMERVKTQLKLRHQQKMLENMNQVLEQKVKERTAQLEESNQKLAEAFEQLKVLDDAKSRFLKLISHEIRTPLNGIVGSTYFLEDMVQDPEHKEFISILKESVERLERFAINALFLTQLHTQQFSDTQLQPVNLEEILEKVLHENQTILEEKEINVVKMFNTCPPVLGKEKLIQKSISETLHNAIRFSSGKEIRLSSEENDRFFALKITNSGKEIPLEKLESIKEAFGLAEEHADKSSGLGLAIVNTCQQLVNGNLNIESADGKITVTLQYQKA